MRTVKLVIQLAEYACHDHASRMDGPRAAMRPAAQNVAVHLLCNHLGSARRSWDLDAVDRGGRETTGNDFLSPT